MTKLRTAARIAGFDFNKVITLDFRTATAIINACILEELSLMIIGDVGIGKTELAKAIAKTFPEKVIPIGAIDMGGLRTLVAKKENRDKTHLLISDLQAFDRSPELRQKLTSYLVSLSDSGFIDASYGSEVGNREEPMNWIIFGNVEHLQYLFREGASRKPFLDRTLVIFVSRDKSEANYNARNEIQYELEFEVFKSISDERKIDADLLKTIVMIPWQVSSARKIDQLRRLTRGLYEIGFDGTITIYNHLPQPSDYYHYFKEIWLKQSYTIEINQSERKHWSELSEQLKRQETGDKFRKCVDFQPIRNWHETILPRVTRHYHLERNEG